MDRLSLTFCSLSLIGTFGFISIIYPMASISTEKLKDWKEPAQAEELPDINLGDFGNVSVGELIDYYIENPPAHSFEDNALTREIRFKGC